MPRNYVRWLAIFLSIIAGTFASQLASKYFSAEAELMISSSPSGLDGSGYETTVALIRHLPTHGESARN